MTPGRKSATVAVYMPGGRGGGKGALPSAARQHAGTFCLFRASTRVHAGRVAGWHACGRLQRTHEDAPAGPAVVPLEPSQDVAEEAKALREGMARDPRAWRQRLRPRPSSPGRTGSSPP